MRILAVNIKNLASIEGTFAIDFTNEPLASAGIFAITGPTGAGKSTILDAICLALYAKTPRSVSAKEQGIELTDISNGKLSQGDTRNILRKGCYEGYAEVVFEAINKQIFKSTWHVRRAKGKIDGNLQAESISLLNVTTQTYFQEKKTETLNEIERLVGLNFEQFTRSVLLAQGDFTAFLKADKDQKAALLEKLTGTDIYSKISKTVFQKCKQAEDVLHQLTIQLDGIKLLSDEELVQKQEELQVLENSREQFFQNIKQTEKSIEWYKQLAEFRKTVDDSRTQLNQVLTTQKAAQDRFVIIEQIDALQAIKPKYEQLIYWQKKLVEIEGDLHQQNRLLDAKRQEEKECLLNKNNNTVELTKYKNDLVNAQPQFDAALVLDHRINDQKKLLLETEELYTTVLKGASDNEQMVLATEKELDILRKDIQEAQNWLQEKSSRKQIAENYALVQAYLNQTTDLLAIIESKSAEKANILDLINTQNREINQLEQKVQVLHNNLEEQRKEKKALFNKIDKNAYSVAKKQVESSQIQLSNINQAFSIWSQLVEKETSSSALTEQMNNASNEILVQKQQLIIKEQLLFTKEIELKTNQQLLQKSLLLSDHYVENLRQTLEENQPCPVCGSTHHEIDRVPNITTQILDEIQVDVDKLQSDINSLHALIGSTKTNIIQLENTVENKQSELHQLTNAYTQLQAQLVENEYYQQWQGRSKEEIYNSFVQTIKHFEGTITAAQETIDLQQKLIEAHANVQSEIATIEQSFWQEKNQLEQLTLQQNHQSANIERIKSELANTNAQLTTLLQILNPFFTNNDWFNNWQSDKLEFEDKLAKFSTEWNKKIIFLQESENQLNLFEQKIQQQKDSLLQKQQEVKALQEKIQKSTDELKQLVLERNQYFNGQPINQVKEFLNNTLKILEEQKADIQYIENEIAKKLTVLETEIDQNTKNREAAQINISTLHTNINDWINDYNRTNTSNLNWITVEALIQKPNEWIQVEKKALAEINQEVTTANANVQSNEELLNKHLAKQHINETVEELLATLEKLQDSLNTTHVNIQEINYLLRENNIKKDQISKVAKEATDQRAIVTNWQQMNELIGSADGKKFRQLAQEYTLDTLLAYANIHLLSLAPRYDLARVPHTLGLQVTDKDMGDEIRSVHSLSGGESFLVSLALALGLASISSQKMKVESLFIDEGFGSLDPNTLNIAMDALEKLQNMGRKVGIISHVQEMTERITTQIMVQKLANGKSSIVVKNVAAA